MFSKLLWWYLQQYEKAVVNMGRMVLLHGEGGSVTSKEWFCYWRGWFSYTERVVLLHREGDFVIGEGGSVVWRGWLCYIVLTSFSAQVAFHYLFFPCRPPAQPCTSRQSRGEQILLVCLCATLHGETRTSAQPLHCRVPASHHARWKGKDKTYLTLK